MTNRVAQCFLTLAVIGGLAAAAVGGCGGSSGSGTGGSSGGGTGGAADCPLGSCYPSPTSLNCAAPITPNALVTDFSPCTWHNTEGKWGACPLIGSIYAYASPTSMGSSRVDRAVTAQNYRFTGTVIAGDYAGAGMQFEACTDVSSFTGIQFTLLGSTGGCELELQFATYDQRPTSQGSYPGSCDTDAGTSCYAYPSAKALATPVDTTTQTTVTVHFADVPNWSDANAKQVVGLQWQATNPTLTDPDAGVVECMIDIRIDDIKFITN